MGMGTGNLKWQNENENEHDHLGPSEMFEEHSCLLADNDGIIEERHVSSENDIDHPLVPDLEGLRLDSTSPCGMHTCFLNAARPLWSPATLSH
jgi:hypothetical protein